MTRQKESPGVRPSARQATAALVVSALLLLAAAATAQTLQNPRRIGAGFPGQFIVSDVLDGGVFAYDRATLQPLWSYSTGEDHTAFGLAQWRKLVFVGNVTTHNVEVYQLSPGGDGGPSFTLEFQFNLDGTPAGQPGTFQNPVDIGIDLKQRLVVVLDSSAKKIFLYDVKGNLVTAFSPADNTGQVLSPVALGVDEYRGEILVSDYGDPSGGFSVAKPARILSYTYGGQLLSQFNGDGSTHPTTKFLRPQGVTADELGRIYVAEALRGQILVLDRNTGETVNTIGVSGTEPGQLLLPLDVCLDPKTGDLFVVNNHGARLIEVFRGVGR